ncbi:MAG: CoA transferase, partial [Actinobacteria bacterium]|nr:CoA transferase [Actinomycetota bacterium]
MSQGPVGSLDGVVVADFTRVLAGPYATMLLGDLGAHVVKVERAGVGDDTRSWAPPRDAEGRATYFESVNRNKRSLSLDLRDPADRERAQALALAADVVVENFVPGTMERFGLGFEQLRASNPRLVYASITGFGTAPAGRELPGYDLLVQASGGLMSVTGATPGQPTKVGVAVVDVITGLHLTIGVLAALRHRDRTGEGQRVDVALLSSLLSALVNQSASYVNGG